MVVLQRRHPVRAFAWAAMASSTFGAHTVVAADTDSVSGALRASKPLIDLRLRSEHVDQDGVREEADAVTLRARLGFETGKFQHTSFVAEGEALWPWRSDYNSTTNGHTAFPIVNDPESYEINRLQLANTSLPDTTVVVGRQRVTLDDERFVSRVGWRQNEQTFDAIHVTNTSLRNLTIDATYLDQVNRVLGKDAARSVPRRQLSCESRLSHLDRDAHGFRLLARLRRGAARLVPNTRPALCR
jgi:hypothetical protein